MEEHHELIEKVTQLCNSFIEDVSEWMKQVDIQYLLGLKKFFTIYMETISTIEPTVSATPKLSSLLHTYLFFKRKQPNSESWVSPHECLANSHFKET